MKPKKTNPPKLFLSFFRWFCHPKLLKHIEGDLLELYAERKTENGKWKADVRFVIDVLLLLRPGIIKSNEGYKRLNYYGMYKNFLITAWRNIVHKKSYALINVFGLTLGITCAVLIFSLVDYHLSFDNFHNDADRIYRCVTEEHRDQIGYDASVPPAFGKAFREDYTYAEKVTRLCTEYEELITIEFEGENKKFSEMISFAEPEFFDIFNFPLISGDQSRILVDPNTAIVTERIAEKYFGHEPAIGKSFRFNNSIDFVITGVLKNLPPNSDIQTEIYFSYSTMKQYNDWYAADDAWGGITTSIKTYTRLKPGVSIAEVEGVLPDYVKKFRPHSKNVHHYKLQPLSEAHFDARYEGVISKTTIWVLFSIGALLILTASLNFINMATAQATTRSKEVGVRKSLGSARGQLFWQFTMETGLIVLISSILAFAFSYSILPYLNTFLDAHISLSLFSDIRLAMFFAFLILIVTLLSGAYPGIIISGFKPVQALKGTLGIQKGGNLNFRRALIVTQFTISQVLLIGLIVMLYQMHSFKTTDMGFNYDAVVMIPTGSKEKLSTIKSQFLDIPGVINVSLCFGAPASNNHWSTTLRFDNRTETENFPISHKGIDEDYLSTFNIDLVAGRNLTPSDTIREFLVNEKLVEKLGLLSPEEILGRSLRVNGDWQGPIVGVVKDFHEMSLHSEIMPVFLTTSAPMYNSIAVKINMQDVKETLGALEKTWSAMNPDKIYKYDFLNDQIAEFYEAEQKMVVVVQVFSCIALIIGGLGLYGLVSFMSIQKTKEIGIRKVLGGNVSQILLIFGKEFSTLVAIAFLIASPIGWLLMTRWLSNYAYKVDIGIWIFGLELLIISIVVLITVGYRSMKAVVANPVDSLRSE